MALFDRGTKSNQSQKTTSTKENLSNTKTAQQTGTTAGTQVNTSNLDAASYAELAKSLSGLSGDIGSARDLAGIVGDRTRSTFDAQAAGLRNDFAVNGMQQINEQKQQIGSTDNTASMEIQNRGEQDLQVRLAALGAQVEQQATQNEFNAYNLITQLTGAQTGVGNVLKGANTNSNIRQEQQQTTNASSATASIEDLLAELTGSQKGTQSPSLLDNITQAIGAFF